VPLWAQCEAERHSPSCVAFAPAGRMSQRVSSVPARARRPWHCGVSPGARVRCRQAAGAAAHGQLEHARRVHRRPRDRRLRRGGGRAAHARGHLARARLPALPPGRGRPATLQQPGRRFRARAGARAPGWCKFACQPHEWRAPCGLVALPCLGSGLLYGLSVSDRARHAWAAHADGLPRVHFYGREAALIVVFVVFVNQSAVRRDEDGTAGHVSASTTLARLSGRRQSPAQALGGAPTAVRPCARRRPWRAATRPGWHRPAPPLCRRRGWTTWQRQAPASAARLRRTGRAAWVSRRRAAAAPTPARRRSWRARAAAAAPALRVRPGPADRELCHCHAQRQWGRGCCCCQRRLVRRALKARGLKCFATKRYGEQQA